MDRNEAPKPPKFVSYKPMELKRIGESFRAVVSSVWSQLDRGPGTGIWTDFVLDWFCATAAPGRVVDARPRATRGRPAFPGIPQRQTLGEFMLDMTHSTFPDYKDGLYSAKYWSAATDPARRVRLDLALECEFGRRSDRNSKFMIYEDAAKLAVVNASVKVLVFGSQDESERDDIVKVVERLRRGARDAAPWLLVDLPWKVSAANWAPAIKLLG